MPDYTENLPAARIHSSKEGLIPEYKSGEEYDGWIKRLEQCFGTENQDIAELAARSIASSFKRGDDKTVNAIIAEMQEMKPNDALERCLIMQTLLVSKKAFEIMSESNKCVFEEEKRQKIAASASLMRLFLNQLDALRRYRCKEHKISVTHIQAQQAIIGDVHTTGEKNGKNE